MNNNYATLATMTIVLSFNTIMTILCCLFVYWACSDQIDALVIPPVHFEEKVRLHEERLLHLEQWRFEQYAEEKANN